MINKHGIDEIVAVFFWLEDYPVRFDDSFSPEDADFDDFDHAREVYFRLVNDPAMKDYLFEPRQNATNWIKMWGSKIK